MLETLLQSVAEGGVHSYDDLTGRLSISPGMLEALLADLARLGYLRAVSGGCDGACHGCSMGGCSIAGPGRLWVLTEKGNKAATRLA